MDSETDDPSGCEDVLPEPKRFPVLSMRTKWTIFILAMWIFMGVVYLGAYDEVVSNLATLYSDGSNESETDTGQIQLVPLLWDGFKHPDEWYLDIEGTGTVEHHNTTTLVLKKTTTTDGARATLLEDGWASSSRDGEWLYTSIEIGLRLSGDPEGKPGPGWRGWGFGVGPDAAHPAYSLCFSRYSDDSDPSLVGLRAQVTTDRSVIALVPLSGVDLQDWHTYTVLWGADSATFLIDGEVVANTKQVPQVPMHVGIGLSNNAFKLLPNRQLDCSEIGLPLPNDVWIQIDHIQVYLTPDKISQYREETRHILQAASTMIQRAEDRELNTEKMREHLAAATDMLANGYVPGHLYIKIRAMAYLTAEDLDQLSALFHTATQRLQTAVTDPGKQTIMEADYARAQDQWDACNFELSEHYLQMIVGGTTQETEEAQE